MTDLRADLLGRLAALKAHGPSHPHPSSKVQQFYSTDEPGAKAPVHVAPPPPVPVDDDPQSGQRVPANQRADRPGLGHGSAAPGGYQR